MTYSRQRIVARARDLVALAGQHVEVEQPERYLVRRRIVALVLRDVLPERGPGVRDLGIQRRAFLRPPAPPASRDADRASPRSAALPDRRVPDASPDEPGRPHPPPARRFRAPPARARPRSRSPGPPDRTAPTPPVPPAHARPPRTGSPDPPAPEAPARRAPAVATPGPAHTPNTADAARAAS